MKKITIKTSLTSFIDYFLEFYGDKGLYPTIIGKLPEKELRECLITLILGIESKGNIFYGDTVDRELLRDLILHRRGFETEHDVSEYLT